MNNVSPLDGHQVTFRYGTFEEYQDASKVKDPNTFYVCYDVKRIFLGSVEYTQPVVISDRAPTSEDVYPDGSMWVVNSNVPAVYIAVSGMWKSTNQLELKYIGEFNSLADLKTHIEGDPAKPGNLYLINFKIENSGVGPGYVIANSFSDHYAMGVKAWINDPGSLRFFLPRVSVKTFEPVQFTQNLSISGDSSFYYTTNNNGLIISIDDNIVDGWVGHLTISTEGQPGDITVYKGSALTLAETSLNGISLSELKDMFVNNSQYIMLSKRANASVLDWYLFTNILDKIPFAEDNLF